MELIESLEILGFRTFSSLKISSFGKVNLITGKNNSGKSTLLEAIRILATSGSQRTIYEILNFREELGTSADDEQNYLRAGLLPFCNLFNGIPRLETDEQKFCIQANGKLPQSIARLVASIGWYVMKPDTFTGRLNYKLASADLFGDLDSAPALSIEVGNRQRIFPADLTLRNRPFRPEPDAAIIPCVYLDPFSSRSTNQLSALWDAITLTAEEQEVVAALRLISEDIEAISMIGSAEGRQRPRTAIVRSTRFASPVPLRSYGDGANRLFGLILSICNARNGVLLVDEIENGLHYTVQPTVWKTIFRLAHQLNVQVFATSHSWECVSAFQEAAAESTDRGVLVRLTRRDSDVIPTLFSEEELAIAARDQIEVR